MKTEKSNISNMNNMRPNMYPCNNPNSKFKEWNQKDYQQHDKVCSSCLHCTLYFPANHPQSRNDSTDIVQI